MSASFKRTRSSVQFGSVSSDPGGVLDELQSVVAAAPEDELTQMMADHAHIDQLDPKDQLEYSMELNRQLKAIEAELDARDTAGMPAGAGALSPSPSERSSVGMSPSGRTSAGMTPSGRKQGGRAGRAAPRRRNRTHTPMEEITIRRHNLGLLSNLERIQRKGGGTDNRPTQKVKHVAAARINRGEKQRQINQQNLAFLKRLNGVKSSMRSTMGKTGRRPTVGGVATGAPHCRRPRQKKPKAKPQWVDISVGPPPRR